MTTTTDRIRAKNADGRRGYLLEEDICQLEDALDALCDHHDATQRILSDPAVLALAKERDPDGMIEVANAGDRVERSVSDG